MPAGTTWLRPDVKNMVRSPKHQNMSMMSGMSKHGPKHHNMVSHTPRDHPYIPTSLHFFFRPQSCFYMAVQMSEPNPWMVRCHGWMNFFGGLVSQGIGGHFYRGNLHLFLPAARMLQCLQLPSLNLRDSEPLDFKLMPKRNIQLRFDNDVNKKPQTTSTKQCINESLKSR